MCVSIAAFPSISGDQLARCPVAALPRGHGPFFYGLLRAAAGDVMTPRLPVVSAHASFHPRLEVMM